MKYIIQAKTENVKTMWAFSESKTGQLDFYGKIEASKLPDLSSYDVLESSPYFSGVWYTWLPEELNASIKVYVPKNTAIDSDLFAFLTHIGPLLCAVENKDGLLAAELYNRRPYIFTKFAILTRYIIEPVAVEALFAWLYGRFSETIAFENHYYNKKKLGKLNDPKIKLIESLLERESEMCESSIDTGIFFYEAAKKRLQPDVAKETPEQMFIRYFSEHNNTELTLGIVGAQFKNWAVSGLDYLESILKNETAADFIAHTSRVKDARNDLFKNADTSVQAEPYNPHDQNAVAVYLDDLESFITGNGGKTKAGYIRATGAAILRTAKPAVYAYKASLARIGDYQDGKTGVVVRMAV